MKQNKIYKGSNKIYFALQPTSYPPPQKTDKISKPMENLMINPEKLKQH